MSKHKASKDVEKVIKQQRKKLSQEAKRERRRKANEARQAKYQKELEKKKAEAAAGDGTKKESGPKHAAKKSVLGVEKKKSSEPAETELKKDNLETEVAVETKAEIIDEKAFDTEEIKSDETNLEKKEELERTAEEESDGAQEALKEPQSEVEEPAEGAQETSDEETQEASEEVVGTSEDPEEEAAEESQGTSEAPEEEPADESQESSDDDKVEESQDDGPSFLEVKEEPVSKERRSSKLILPALIFILLVAGAAVATHLLNGDTFMKGSELNGVDVAGMTSSEAEKALVKEWNHKTVRITENGSVVDTIRATDLTYDIAQQVEDALHPSILKQFTRIFWKKGRVDSVEMRVEKTSKRFNKDFKKLSIVKSGKGTVKTKNAYVDLSNTDFKVVSEVYGDNVDKKKLKKKILSMIALDEDTLKYSPKDYYTKPTVREDSPQIQEDLKYAKTYLTQKITIKEAGHKHTLTPKQLNSMMQITDTDADDAESVTRTIKKGKIKKYLRKEIVPTCSTIGITRHLNLVGGKVTISGGNYGTTVDVSKTAAAIAKAIESGEDKTLSLIYTSTGWGSSTSTDIGNSYVEVSIGKQHVWCVIDGKTVVSTDVVTGNVAEGNGTPTGVFSLMYKVSPATLEGTNSDGSKYKTPVTYWMPFYAGCGFHDASWRGVFGGSIYLSGGSHGCVNMPPAQAAKLYQYVGAGMPIVVHP